MAIDLLFLKMISRDMDVEITVNIYFKNVNWRSLRG